MMQVFRVLVVAAILIGVSGSHLAAQSCPGDCNGNDVVAVNELVTGVNILLGRALRDSCPAMDVNNNGAVAINELVAAVNSSLNGCGFETPTRTPTEVDTEAPTATPTQTPVDTVAFSEVQAILTDKCAIPGCHVGQFASGDLSLAEGESFDELVGVAPANGAAAEDGILRVDPGDATNSFLVVKTASNPPPIFGSRMPLIGSLTDQEISTIREWVNGGANNP